MSLTAIGLVAVTAFADDGSPQSSPTVWGDVTCDNRVDLRDVSDLLLRSSGIEKFAGCASEQLPVVAHLDSAATSAKLGDVVTVSIYADANIPGTGIGNAKFDIAFDPLVLSPASCIARNGGCNTIAPGTTRWGLISASETGWVGKTKLGSIDFLVVGGVLGSTTNVSLQNFTFDDQHGNRLSDAVRNRA
jgi:hypothetical protein